MTCDELMRELAALGSAQTIKVLRKHGLPEQAFGVKIGDMKPLGKRIKVDHALALALWETGNADARYFAGLIADPAAFSAEQLQHWAETADWHMLSEYAVAWCVAESRFGWELALAWINSPKERVACAGWASLSSLVGLTPDERLDLPALRALLTRVRDTLHGSPNRVRYVMNGFLLATGCFVAPLTQEVLAIAAALGKVRVDMGDTACQVPDIAAYIEKVRQRGSLGKKRKSARCR
jgi:3-methyladenine DNA glycosylase AlkD